jgi:hypothetical protein
MVPELLLVTTVTGFAAPTGGSGAVGGGVGADAVNEMIRSPWGGCGRGSALADGGGGVKVCGGGMKVGAGAGDTPANELVRNAWSGCGGGGVADGASIGGGGTKVGGGGTAGGCWRLAGAVVCGPDGTAPGFLVWFVWAGSAATVNRPVTSREMTTNRGLVCFIRLGRLVDSDLLTSCPRPAWILFVHDPRAKLTDE